MRRITNDSRHPYQHLKWKITNTKKIYWQFNYRN